MALAPSVALPQAKAETVPEDELASLDVTITNIRKDEGLIRLAICKQGDDFPDCGENAVRTADLQIEAGVARAKFSGIPAGFYAVSVFHDANGNGKLDTFLGIPREGYGFSGNPPFRPRAPRFSEAQIEIAGKTEAAIKLRHVL
jgi:uncharacterized protein (DUF2141 family)